MLWLVAVIVALVVATVVLVHYTGMEAMDAVSSSFSL